VWRASLRQAFGGVVEKLDGALALVWVPEPESILTRGSVQAGRSPRLRLKRRLCRADTTLDPPPGGFSLSRKPSRFVVGLELFALAAAVVVGALGESHWDLPLFAALLVFSVASDVTASDTSTNVKISGSFLSLVLAMVFLGGPPAAVIGVATIALGWFRWRDEPYGLLNNLVAYAWFPLLGGLAFDAATDGFGITKGVWFYLLVFATFMVALAANFLIIAMHRVHLEKSTTMPGMVRKLVIPVLPSELAAALLAAGIAYLYDQVGLAAIALFGVVLFTFQYLLGQLLLSEERAEELERSGEQLRTRTKQLASLQVGVLSAIMHTLDLRDRMTARHCAAVARYAREIALAAGFSQEDQELVHTAGLMHDIGKFIFPDRILKTDTKLTEEDWQIIKMHPYQGAKVVRQMEGYGPVGDIILAHHERWDGKGYPRGLAAEEIPALSRIISVADTYDVMTARDSYRKPVSSFEAIQELRRVSGAQLDGKFVEIFIEVLAGKDVKFRHGEDADFDRELGIEKRVKEYSMPVPQVNGEPSVEAAELAETTK
jgi:putative nucleotidyltransferase with HDIG domain